jgi:GTPase SAR1 family protein
MVSFEDGEILAREFKIPYYETSAMNDINVDEAFMKITRDVHTKAQVGNNIGVLKSSASLRPAVDIKATPPKRSWCSLL